MNCHHERSHARAFVCEICDARFTWSKDLERHLTKHSGQKKYLCHLCQLTFTRKDNLLRHARHNHRFIQANHEVVGTHTGVIECAGFGHTSEQPSASLPSQQNTFTTPKRPPASGKKRKTTAPDDDDDGDDTGESPKSGQSSGGASFNINKPKLVCIFRRRDPRRYGDGDATFRTCKETGFHHISELRCVMCLSLRMYPILRNY